MPWEGRIGRAMWRKNEEISDLAKDLELQDSGFRAIKWEHVLEVQVQEHVPSTPCLVLYQPTDLVNALEI